MIRALMAGCAVLTLLTAVQTVRVERLKTELRTVTAERNDARKLAGAIQTVARSDAQTQATECQARVDDARASAQRIERIIERPIHVDPQGCAVRDLVPADELRDALQPSPADPAKPLH